MLRRRTQRGFTLIEVLVTIFVLAIGLLSAAALQAMSKKAAYDAMQRSTASVLVQDMLERMRANNGVAELAAYAPTSGLQIDATQVPAATTCDSSRTCTPQVLVQHDLYNWWRGLDGAAETIANDSGSQASAGGLRSPTGCIRNLGLCHYQVVVAWRGVTPIAQGDSSNAADPTNDHCGENNSDYDDPKTSGTDHRYRRVLVEDAYIMSGNGPACP